MWANVRRLGLTKDGPPATQFSVNEINNFFVNSVPFNGDVGSLFVFSGQTPSHSQFGFQTVDEFTILAAISSIKSNAVGDDGVPLKFLKIMMPVILPFICHLFNSCIVDSVFPSQWKISKIIPITKVMRSKTVSDMRPISILPVLSKVFEIIMKIQITEFLSSHNLLIPLQSGFRSKHSTTTAMLKITDDISSSLDVNQVVFLVLLDFSKALTQ